MLDKWLAGAQAGAGERQDRKRKAEKGEGAEARQSKQTVAGRREPAPLAQRLPEGLGHRFHRVPGDGECFYWSMAVALRLPGSEWLMSAAHAGGWTPLVEESEQAARWRAWALKVRADAVRRMRSAEFRRVLAEDREFVKSWEEYAVWRCKTSSVAVRREIAQQTGLVAREWWPARWESMRTVAAALQERADEWRVEYEQLEVRMGEDGEPRRLVEQALVAHTRHRTWATSGIMYAVAWNLGVQVVSLVSPSGIDVLDGMVWYVPGHTNRRGQMLAGTTAYASEGAGDMIAQRRSEGERVLAVVHMHNNHFDAVVLHDGVDQAGWGTAPNGETA